VEPVTLQTLCQWADGTLLNGDPERLVSNLCTDSRALKRGDLFLALRGENFDGHAFVSQASGAGAAGAVVDREIENPAPNFAVIKVSDTLAALQQIAANYRRSLPLKAVIITGSNGKTSTKDFTAAVLAVRCKVIKTEGNLNNHIGLPLTILRASAGDRIGVFEIGMNHPGEIGPLAKIAAPDVGIITNIGVAHIEFMGTRAAIALEKGMLAEALSAGGQLVLDAEDEFTAAIAARTKAAVILAGRDVRVTDVCADAGGSRFLIHAGDQSAEVRLPVPGRHMIRNALLAVTTGTLFGLTLEECAAGLCEAHLSKGRLEQKIIRGIRIIDDSYNANPDSMVAALQTLAEMPASGRRIAVLGKMNELGAESERGHRLVGEAAGREGIECLVAVGEGASPIADAAGESGVREVIRTATTGEAADVLRKLAQAGDVILLKGSRSVKMEKILEGLAA